MPDLGPGEWLIMLVIVGIYVGVVLAIIALPVFVLREMRRRGAQLDRIEQRLNDLDGRGGPADRR